LVFKGAKIFTGSMLDDMQAFHGAGVWSV